MSIVLRKIPISLKTCGAPTSVGDSEIFGYEEAGTLWLWGWPSLIGWLHEITWLFSPVTGKRPWPGDLWGVDAAGNLLIVEAKLAKRTGGTDPFQDFVDYTVPPVDQLIADLRKRWSRDLALERDFIRDHAAALHEGRFALRTCPGLVPYSRQRREVRRWRHLYLDNIVPLFGNEDHERCVEANLRLYKAADDHRPHYIGLFTLLGNRHAALSKRGEQNYRRLANRLGADHLHMFAVQARWLSQSEESCEIQSYGLHPTTAKVM